MNKIKNLHLYSNENIQKREQELRKAVQSTWYGSELFLKLKAIKEKKEELK